MEQITIKDALKVKAVERAFANPSEFKIAPSEEIHLALEDDSLAMPAKSRAIYNSTGKIINDLFENEITPDKIHEAKNSISALLSGVISDQITISSLIQVSNYDYYTYTHCVNVSVYAIGLARDIGLSTKELELIGTGGILHDLGKAKISLDIVNKPGRLTEFEYKQMKNHPAYGYNILTEQSENDEIILTCVRHHHEKINGMGYPDGIMGSKLSIYARIVAICDIFDALSTKRSYKPALSTFEALNLMHTKMKSELDSRLLAQFIKMMGKS